jgi:hypothetical protein
LGLKPDNDRKFSANKISGKSTNRAGHSSENPYIDNRRWQSTLRQNYLSKEYESEIHRYSNFSSFRRINSDFNQEKGQKNILSKMVENYKQSNE